MSIQTLDYFNILNKKKITAFGFEFIKDNQNKLPIVRSMSEIAGNTTLLIAGEYLSNVNNGKGLMLGGISGLTPANVVVIGAGTVGEYACRTALGLGASVIVFDNSLSKLRRLQNNINQRISTSSIQPKALMKSLRRADVVISALQVGDGKVSCIVSEEMVMDMKKGAVVIDVSIDQGGSFETSEITSHKNPVFIKHDVIHYCVPNIASRVSRTASMAISNILTPILLIIAEEGGLEHSIRKHECLRSGVYAFNGSITNEVLSKNFKLPFSNLDLIMSSR
jgi:alanine dehydrogenase